MAATDDGPDIPDSTIPDIDELPESLSGPFWELLGERKREQRDLKIILTAKDGETGVGKSVCGTFIAKVADTTQDGFDANRKASLDPQEFFKMYKRLEPGSGAILDEAEQLDSRRAMASENVDATHVWQQQRVREIVAILILPSPEEIDRRLERLADVWINVERRGKARAYRKRIHPIKRKVYYETMQTFEFPNLSKDPDYRALSEMKLDMIDDPDRDSNWIRQSEHEKELEKLRKQVRQETRNEIIQKLDSCRCSACDSEYRYKDIAPAVDLSAARVGQIARGE